MPELHRFHLAIPVDDLDAARRFYGEALGCSSGRTDARWHDWNLYGHQLVTHLIDGPPAGGGDARGVRGRNPVDAKAVPVPHLGVILDVEEFHALAGRVRDAGVRFEIEPYVRFEGQVGEQWTMFFFDPAGNALEFKAFAHDEMVFASN